MRDEERIRQKRLADRFEIQDVIYRWCRAIDRCDWGAMRPLFHDDAVDDHGLYCGNIDGMIDWLIARHPAIIRCQHSVSNMLIEFAGNDTALVESHMTACQRHRNPESGPSGAAEEYDFVGFGRYVDRFERRDGIWRILKRTVLIETSLRFPVDPQSANAMPERNWSRRDGCDVIQEERSALGIV